MLRRWRSKGEVVVKWILVRNNRTRVKEPGTFAEAVRDLEGGLCIVQEYKRMSTDAGLMGGVMGEMKLTVVVHQSFGVGVCLRSSAILRLVTCCPWRRMTQRVWPSPNGRRGMHQVFAGEQWAVQNSPLHMPQAAA